MNSTGERDEVKEIEVEFFKGPVERYVMNNVESEIEWAVRNLKSRYQDSLKAVSMFPDFETARENVRQYQQLAELATNLATGKAKIVVVL